MRPRCRGACYPAGSSASGRQPSRSAERRRSCVGRPPHLAGDGDPTDYGLTSTSPGGGMIRRAVYPLAGPWAARRATPGHRILIDVDPTRSFRLNAQTISAQCSTHPGPPTPSRPRCSPIRGGTKDKTLAAELSDNFGPTDARKSAASLPNSGGHHKFHCDT